MRHIVLEEPLARTAVWSRSCAFFAVAEALIGIVMARNGLDPLAAVAIEGGAMLIALLAIAFAIAAIVVIWRNGYRGSTRLVTALVLAILVLAYPAYLIVGSRGVPSVGDVSTDLADPPRFSTNAQARAARGGAMLSAPSEAVKDNQRRFYADIKPLVLDIEPPDAFTTITKLIASRHWRVVDTEVPLEQTGSGRIDAIAASPIMGFPADVTVRIKPQGGQSVVDIRSVSRTRFHEPAADARRVEALVTDIEDQLDQQ